MQAVVYNAFEERDSAKINAKKHAVEEYYLRQTTRRWKGAIMIASGTGTIVNSFALMTAVMNPSWPRFRYVYGGVALANYVLCIVPVYAADVIFTPQAVATAENHRIAWYKYHKMATTLDDVLRKQLASVGDVRAMELEVWRAERARLEYGAQAPACSSDLSCLTARIIVNGTDGMPTGLKKRVAVLATQLGRRWWAPEYWQKQEDVRAIDDEWGEILRPKNNARVEEWLREHAKSLAQQ